MTKRYNKTEHKSITSIDLKETYLSIQISLDGFSFFIYEPDTAVFIAQHKYRFELENRSPEALLEGVETIFKENRLLQETYKKVTVFHDNSLVTLVPSEYFEEAHLSAYLENNIKLLEDDHIAFDHLENDGIYIVYVPYVNINNLLFSSFGSFEYYHISTLFLDLKNKYMAKETSNNCFINCYDTSFDMLLYSDGNLIFYNRYEYRTATDFIYYILFALEQNDLDPNEIAIELTGTIKKDSDVYKMAYNYIRNLSFYNEKNAELSEDFSEFPKHENYTALHQYRSNISN
jgi:hypothetical protein